MTYPQLLESGAEYRLTNLIIGEKVDEKYNVLPAALDRQIPAGAQFKVENWNEWRGTSGDLKKQSSNPNHYIITLKQPADGWLRYQVMAAVLGRAATKL